MSRLRIRRRHFVAESSRSNKSPGEGLRSLVGEAGADTAMGRKSSIAEAEDGSSSETVRLGFKENLGIGNELGGGSRSGSRSLGDRGGIRLERGWENTRSSLESPAINLPEAPRRRGSKGPKPTRAMALRFVIVLVPMLSNYNKRLHLSQTTESTRLLTLNSQNTPNSLLQTRRYLAGSDKQGTGHKKGVLYLYINTRSAIGVQKCYYITLDFRSPPQPPYSQQISITFIDHISSYENIYNNHHHTLQFLQIYTYKKHMQSNQRYYPQLIK
nr:hypothetical protein Itr_chr07CG01270 [Ipomoea trifida]